MMKSTKSKFLLIAATMNYDFSHRAKQIELTFFQNLQNVRNKVFSGYQKKTVDKPFPDRYRKSFLSTYNWIEPIKLSWAT